MEDIAAAIFRKILSQLISLCLVEIKLVSGLGEVLIPSSP